MTRRLFAGLIPGDTFIHRDARGAVHMVTVLEVRPASYTDRFGRTFDALYCETDGRRGIVPFGPAGTCETPDDA